jgi:hypothetical protein
VYSFGSNTFRCCVVADFMQVFLATNCRLLRCDNTLNESVTQNLVVANNIADQAGTLHGYGCLQVATCSRLARSMQAVYMLR